MTNDDKLQFKEVFEKLARVFGRKFDKDDMKAYFAVLSDLPLRAVGEAAFTLAREGTSDNWFPRAPEWYDLAAQIAIDLDEAEQRTALQPDPEEVARELDGIRAAREKLIAECRRRGNEPAARFFEKLPMLHPSEDPEAPICRQCGDAGRVYDDDGRWGKRCACAPHNPVLRRLARKAKHRALVTARSRRADELAPSHGGRSMSRLTTGGA